MGIAAAYDTWFDPGLAFGEDELRGFVTGSVAESRVKRLTEFIHVIERHGQIPGTAKKAWWAKVQAKCIDTITWYCVVGELPGIDRELIRSIPEPDTDEGKRLTIEAQRLNEEEFLSEWKVDLVSCMRYFVSITRNCAAAKASVGWTRADGKKANRVANALKREMDVVEMVSGLLNSLTR
jgi:hypothetical protein